MVMDHFAESLADSTAARHLRVQIGYIKEDRLHCCPNKDMLQIAMTGARRREFFCAVKYGSVGPPNLNQNGYENFT